MTRRRYEISMFVGPCTEDEATTLAERIMGLPEFKAVGGGGVGLTRIATDDPLFVETKS